MDNIHAELELELAGIITEVSKFSNTVESNKAEAMLRRARRVALQVFGKNSDYIRQLDALEFPAVIGGTISSSGHQKWMDNSRKLGRILSAMQDEIEAKKVHLENPQTNTQSKTISNKIFIVHGHDDGMKQHVARVVSALGLEPIILHEKPNMGKTIIEKFDSNTDVNFAIVLLSPDDIGFPKSVTAKSGKSRARQNVVFEFGYFVGKLGRPYVLPLLRNDSNFEIPTDLLGVVYVPYDGGSGWIVTLVRELKQAGYDVDANKVLHL